MSDTNDPARPTPNSEKFKPQNVADEQSANTGRKDRDMNDVARGSEGDRRRNSQNRS